jgi:hypothetical protein
MEEKTIDREMLRRFKIDLDEAMKPLAEKYGLKLEAVNATFLNDRFTMKVAALLKGAKSVEENLYEMKFVHYGLPHIDSVVTLRGERYTIRGMRTKSHKVVIERIRDKKRFLCTPEYIVKETNPAASANKSAKNSYLVDFIRDKNAMWKLFGSKGSYPEDPKKLTLQQAKEIRNMIDNALSPENLTCDGELKGSALTDKTKRLQGAFNEIRQLIKDFEKSSDAATS